MKIDTLYLKNFRNVIEKEYGLNSHFTVFIGINGRGKSTWLHALRIACGAFLLKVPDAPSRHIHEDEIRLVDHGTFAARQTPVIVEAKGTLSNGSIPLEWRRRIPEGKSKTTFSKEDVGKIREIGAKKYRKMVRGSENLDLPLIAFFGTSRVHGTGRKRESRTRRLIFKDGYNAWSEMRSSIFGYQAWLDSFDALSSEGMEYPETKDAFYETLKKANPYIQKVGFVAGELWLKVAFDDYESGYLPVRLHSDGIIAFTEMVAEMAYRCIALNGYKKLDAIEGTEGVVMIDEIDLHLHPNWQKRVIGDLKNAFPKIQFVATTHSPFIVQSLDKEELINLDLEEEEEGLSSDPVNYGIEDIAEIEMGVGGPRSEKFQEKVELALKYYSLLAEGKNSDNHEATRELRRKLDELEERFSNDPYFVSTLKWERKVAEK